MKLRFGFGFRRTLSPTCIIHPCRGVGSVPGSKFGAAFIYACTLLVLTGNLVNDCLSILCC